MERVPVTGIMWDCLAPEESTANYFISGMDTPKHSNRANVSQTLHHACRSCAKPMHLLPRRPTHQQVEPQSLVCIENFCTSSPLCFRNKKKSWPYDCRWCQSCPCCKQPCFYSTILAQPCHCCKQPCSRFLIPNDSCCSLP